MPPALTDSEINALIDEAVLVIGAKGIQDMGKVMAELKPKLVGRADMAIVSTLIKGKIAN